MKLFQKQSCDVYVFTAMQYFSEPPIAALPVALLHVGAITVSHPSIHYIV
jgi:hypothetical protein